MAGTLRVTHKALGAEVRRAPYEVEVDGVRVGSVAMNRTLEASVSPGRHTVSVRSGRGSSRPTPFEVHDGEVVSFRCTGKRILPLFLASFVVPSLRLVLVRA